MRIIWQQAVSTAVAALLVSYAPAYAADGATRRMMVAGDYAAAALRLTHASVGVKAASLDDRLLLAEANERAEGSFSITEDALDSADTVNGNDAGSKERRVQILEIRALLRSREGRFAEAARFVLEARSVLGGAHTTDPDIPSAVGETYGVVLLRMGLYAEGMAVLVTVCDERINALPAGDTRLLESLYWLGIAEMHNRKLPEARETLQEVVRLRTRVLGVAHPETLQARAALAAVLVQIAPVEGAHERVAVLEAWLHRSDRRDARIVSALLDVAEDEEANNGAAAAMVHLREAYGRAIAATNPIERLTAEAGLRLAKALNVLGRYGEALDVLSEAWNRSPQIRHVVQAYDAQVTRAVLYSQLNRPQDAERTYREVLAIYDSDPTLSRANRLTLLNNLTGTLAAQGKYGAAVTVQREVVAERTRLLGANAALTLSAKSSLASFLSHGLRTDLDEAIALHREVLAARLAASPSDKRSVALSLHNLAVSLDEAQQYWEAKEKILAAIALRERLLGSYHPETILSKREFAGILFSQGDIAGARAAYGPLIASLERVRIQSTATDEQRRTFFADFAQTYKAMAIIEAHSGSDSAFAYADAAHGRTLNELASSSDALRVLASSNERSALAEARAVLGRLASADTSAMSAEERTNHAVAIDAASADVRHVESALESAHPQLRFTSTFQPIGKAQLRAAMGEDTLLLNYIVLKDRVQLLWIAPDGTKGASELMTLPRLTETAKAYLALLSAPALTGTAADPLVDRAVFAWPDGSFRIRRLDDEIPPNAEIVTGYEALRDALSEKLLGALPLVARSAKRWVVVPDGPLAAIPFDTLSLDGKLVVERSAVSYAPSLRMLVSMHERLAAYRGLQRAPMMVIGAPAYSAAPAGSALRAWKELVGSRAEVEAFRQRYRLVEGKTLFSGVGATELRLRKIDRSGVLGNYKLLLFSSHGMIDLASPERNSIILLGDNAGPDSDGFVRAAELLSVHTRADLIIVSACESGVGDWLDGEGAMGLPFALFASGGAASLLTNWSIPDRSSAAFMTRFVEKLDKGMTAANALQETKTDFLAGREGESRKTPAYWAAFSLFGAD